MEFVRCMLYKAIRRQDGKHVVVDPEHLRETTKIVTNWADHDLALSLGWCKTPTEALAQLEAQEDELSTNAAVRAHDDLRMSEKAHAEMDKFESKTVRHVLDLPS